MRLIKHIKEQVDESPGFTKFINMVKRDCKPYINLLKGREPLMRGMDGNDYGEKDVRQNRQPRHPRGSDVLTVTDKIKGKLVKNQEPYWPTLQKWLVSLGHVPRNSSISVTSDFGTANSFGSDPYWIYPKGKFKYSFVRSDDFNIPDQTGWKPDELKYYFQHWLSKDPDKEPWGAISKFDPTKFVHSGKGFQMAYTKEYEIWIQCKSFYYIGCSPSIMYRRQAIHFAEQMGFYDHAQGRQYPIEGSRWSKKDEPKKPISNNDEIMSNLAAHMKKEKLDKQIDREAKAKIDAIKLHGVKFK